MLGLCGLGGCAIQPAVFSWYHPQGGEYLFTYDSDECAERVSSAGMDLGTNLQGPFFQCMHQRGYYLVDADGIVQAPEQTLSVAGPSISQQ
jgi:hypothetical protein